MKPIVDSITTFLQADGWPLHPIEGQSSYSMRFQGKSGEWTCIAQAFEPERRFVFYSACPIQASNETNPAVAELLTRINYTLLVGNFEMNFLNGDIRCRTSIDSPGHELGAFLIQQVIYINVSHMDAYLPAIRAVIEQGMSPLDAIHTLLTSAAEI